MKKVLVELKNERALNLLKDLQNLEILKVLSTNNLSETRLSDKYQGAIPEHMADELNEKLDNNLNSIRN